MKRSLVAATAVALLLTGCATGDTGHLVPDIEPDLVGPRSTPEPVAAGGGDDGGGGDSAGSGDQGGSGDPTDVRTAFEESAGSEPWFNEVSQITVDDGAVEVTTNLTESGADAVAVCEAAVDAVESTGAEASSVEVLDADRQVLSELDAATGDETCSG